MDGSKGKSSGQVRTMSNICFAAELRALRLMLMQALGAKMGAQPGQPQQRAAPQPRK